MARFLHFLIALFLFSQAAQAISVTNFSFEDTGSVIGNANGTFSYNTSVSPPGWTVTSGTVEIVTRWGGTEGARSLDLNGVGAGSISQVLSGFVAGDSYRLTFDMGGNLNFGFSRSQTAQASIAGQSQNFTWNAEPTDTLDDFTFTEMTLDFVAGAATETLQFTQITLLPSEGAVLDNIRVDRLGGPAPVPLPAGMALMATGLGALAVARRRHAV